MLLKRIIKKDICFTDGALIKLDEYRSFSISREETENEYIFYIHDIKGEFNIISFPDTTYDEKCKSFDYAFEDGCTSMCYSIDEEYQECIIYILKIPHQTYTTIKVQQFYKNFFTLPGYEHLKLVYYVKKSVSDTIEVYIVNPYNELMINDKKGDFLQEYDLSNFSLSKYPYYIDLKLALQFTFSSTASNAVPDNIAPTISPTEPQNTSINIKCPLLYDIMSDKTYADVVLFSSTGKEILTYRCILAKYSKIFKSIFEEKTELPVQIKIDEFGTDIITAVLEFCYGKIDGIIGKESDVFKFAEKYEIQEIKEACCTYFETNLNTTNVCSIIEIAYSNNFEDLKEKCKLFIAKNKEEIEFSGLSKNILIDVLKAL